MKAIRKLSVIILLLVLISNSFINVFAASYSVDDIDKRIDSLLNYEYNYTKTNSLEGFVSDYLVPSAGIGECDWFVISLRRNDNRFNYNLYTDSLNKVISNIYKNGVSNTKITELQRMALAYTACNKDIRRIAGNNLLADCSYNRELSELSSQGIMTLDYALILLDSRNFTIPQKALTTRDDIIGKILSLQLDNGGFALTGTAPDADVTAMTVTALAPYIKNNKTVSEAVDRALNRLSIMQKSDGSFANYGKLNCESTAQVIVMLTALGIDPVSDERFIKNGFSAVDALLTYQTEKGGFSHLQNGNENQMATYQAFYALVAYKSYIVTSQGLYNFTDDTNPQQTVTEPKTNSENNNSNNNNKSNSSSQTQNILNNSNNNSSNNTDNYNSSSLSSAHSGKYEAPNNQNNTSSQNNTNNQTSKVKNNTSQTETTTEQQETLASVNTTDSVSSNNTATADEIKVNISISNTNNFQEIKDNKNLLGAENSTGTGIAALILISAYVGLLIYFIKKYNTPHTENKEKGE